MQVLRAYMRVRIAWKLHCARLRTCVRDTCGNVSSQYTSPIGSRACVPARRAYLLRKLPIGTAFGVSPPSARAYTRA